MMRVACQRRVSRQGFLDYCPNEARRLSPPFIALAVSGVATSPFPRRASCWESGGRRWFLTNGHWSFGLQVRFDWMASARPLYRGIPLCSESFEAGRALHRQVGGLKGCPRAFAVQLVLLSVSDPTPPLHGKSYPIPRRVARNNFSALPAYALRLFAKKRPRQSIPRGRIPP